MLNQSLFVKESTFEDIITLKDDIIQLHRCGEAIRCIARAETVYGNLLYGAGHILKCELRLAHVIRLVLETIATDNMYRLFIFIKRDDKTNGWKYTFPSLICSTRFSTVGDAIDSYIHATTLQDLEIICKVLNIVNTLLDQLSAMEQAAGKNSLFAISSVSVVKSCGQTSYLSSL